MPNSLVSVIIPVYNAEKFIIETLDSVFAQTYRPIEIIVVDDGSTDKTAKILKGCQTDKINESSGINLTCMYQQNSGPSKARNTGIKTAKGEYIAFLDADDLWTKNKIEKQIELFRENPEIDIVFTDVKITRLKEGKIQQFIMFQEQKLDREFFGHDFIVMRPFEKLLKINFMLTPSVVVRKSCFKGSIFFNEKRRYTEDWELWLKMSLYFDVGYVNEVCVYVKDEGDGLSSNRLEMCLSSMDIMESFIKENETIRLLLKNGPMSKLLKDKYKWTGYYLMANKHYKLARDFYKKSLRETFDLKTIFYYFRTFLKII